jgi:hypothetical protein
MPVGSRPTSEAPSTRGTSGARMTVAIGGKALTSVGRGGVRGALRYPSVTAATQGLRAGARRPTARR